MFGLGEHADEAMNYPSEPVFRFLRGQIQHRRLVADDQFQFGDESGYERAVGLQGRAKGIPPTA